MRIDELRLTRGAEYDELSAEVGGMRLWYRFPAGPPKEARADPFLAAGLIAAMVRGEALEVAADSPLSPRLLRGVEQIQDILTLWNPALKRASVSGRAAPPSPLENRVAAFFAGGVDAAYTLHRRYDEITDLVFIRGLDLKRDNEILFREALARTREFSSRIAKNLTLVDTNVRELYDRLHVDANLYHGSLLASIALLLPFRTVYISASHTYAELLPWGSHPLLDPLWSTEAVAVVHHGAEARRSEKLAAIASLPGALKILRVCLRNRVYNCGECEKCIGTRLTLRLLGLSTPTLPRLDSLEALRGFRIRSESGRVFFEDNHRLARAVGDAVAERALSRCLRRYALRDAAKRFDRAFLGRRIHRTLASLKKRLSGPRSVSIEITPD